MTERASRFLYVAIFKAFGSVPVWLGEDTSVWQSVPSWWVARGDVTRLLYRTL